MQKLLKKDTTKKVLKSTFFYTDGILFKLNFFNNVLMKRLF